VTSAQAAPDRGRVIAAIAEHADRPAPGSPAFPLQGRNRIDQGEGLLRVVPIGASEAHGERDPLSITVEMPLASAFAAICRVRAGQRSATNRTH
jgi:hypothetical protein